jgi:hypothetical protein
MALVWNGITYDPNRSYGPNEWRYWLKETLDLSATDIDRVFADYQPTPYNLSFTLSIFTNALDHLTQVLENVLPYFNPKLFLRVKEFSFLNVDRDLPVSLDSVIPEFVEEMSENDRRQVNATVNITVEAFLYRPWTYSKIIKVIDSQYYVRDAVNQTSGFTSATSVLTDSYSTSGYETSGGNVGYMPGVVPPTTFTTSGGYIDNTKEFNWFSLFSSSA